MPHQCVRCNTFYDDGSNEILQGCKCGGKLFFFIKKKHLEEQAKEMVENLTEQEKQEIEQDVFELVDIPYEEEKPVVLDFESIHVLAPGKYNIDLVRLFKKEPVIIKVGEGKYIIDLPKTFQQLKEGKLK